MGRFLCQAQACLALAQCGIGRLGMGARGDRVLHQVEGGQTRLALRFEYLALALLQRGLGGQAGAALAQMALRALDGGRQALQVVLEHEVVQAEVQQFHRLFLADTSGNQDHRQIGVARLDTLQGSEEIHSRYVVVRKHKIPVLAQRGVERRIVIDTMQVDRQAPLAQITFQQQEIRRIVLDDEDA